jgi:PAS domain S-box-containing protein
VGTHAQTMKRTISGQSFQPTALTSDDATLRRLVDATADIAWLSHADGSLAHVNQRFLDYAGMELSEALAGSVNVIHPDDLVNVRALWSVGLKRGRIDETVFRLRRAADGRYRWHRARATPVRDGRGRVSGWFGSVVDVDDQRRDATALQFVSKASAVLSQSLDLQETLDRLLDVVVPEMADWAAIDLLEEHERLRTVAVIHADPAQQPLVDQLRGRYTHTPQFERRVSETLRTTSAQVLPQVTDEMVFTAASPRLLPVIRALRPRSAISVPLRSRGRTFGSLAVYWSVSERVYSEDDVPVFEELARRAAAAIENARLYERERMVASAFQRAALPARLPLISGLTFDAVYEPAQDESLIGGDWYDAIRLADGRVVISIGDVSGTGLAAAVRMVSLREVIRGSAQSSADPIAALDAADKTQKSSAPDTLATAFVAVIDLIERTLSYASAGHPPPLLRSADGAVSELAAPDLPLGLRVHGEMTPCVIDVEDDMMVVLYTDGVIEAKRDILAGLEELQRTVAESDSPSSDAAHAIFDTMLEDDSSDDVAIMTVTFSKPEDEPTGAERDLRRWDWSVRTDDAAAVSALRAEIGALLSEYGASAAERATGELVAGELLANAVRYAPGAIDVILDWHGPTPVFHVLDRGPGFVLTPRLPSDAMSEQGRGLFLVWSLADDVNVTRRRGGGAHARAVLSVGGLRLIR